VPIASQIVGDELGFDFPQEVDFKAVALGDGRCRTMRFARCAKSRSRRMNFDAGAKPGRPDGLSRDLICRG